MNKNQTNKALQQESKDFWDAIAPDVKAANDPPERRPGDLSVLLQPMRHIMSLPDKEPDWLVNGVIPMAAVTLIVGEPNVGKSWICMDLCVATATKSNWLNLLPTRKCNILYLAFEDSDLSTRRRLGMILRGRQLSEHALDSSGHYFINLPPQDINIMSAITMESLSSIVRKLDISVVVVDTFRKAAGSVEENDSSAVDRAASNLKRLAANTGAAVIITHHPRKLPGSNDTGVRRVRMDDIRGSSALAGSVDAIICLSQVATSDLGVTLELHVAKQREAKRGLSYGLRQEFLNGGVEFSQAVEINSPHLQLLNKLEEALDKMPDEFILKDIQQLINSRLRAEATALISTLQLTTKNGTKHALVDSWRNIIERERDIATAKALSSMPDTDDTWADDE